MSTVLLDVILQYSVIILVGYLSVCSFAVLLRVWCWMQAYNKRKFCYNLKSHDVTNMVHYTSRCNIPSLNVNSVT